jgi:hypothetical protein
MPRNAAVAAPSSTSASSSYRNRRIRFRRDRNQRTAYSAIAIRSRNAQDITESPRIASTDCVGLSRGSLGGVNLERFVSNSRTRVLTILGQTQNLESAAASSLLNETPAWEGWPAFPSVAALRRRGLLLRPLDATAGQMISSSYNGHPSLIFAARNLIDRKP